VTYVLGLNGATRAKVAIDRPLTQYNIKRLISKLKGYGDRGQLLQWIEYGKPN